MIRPIQKPDIPRCLAWYNWYIDHSTATFEEQPLSLEAFSKRVDAVTARYPWLILEADGKPVGYACLDLFNSKSAYRFTADVTVYLDPEETGKGYGKLLLKALEEQAEQQGIQKLVSIITSDNTASRRLHEKLGYHLISEIHRVGYKQKQWLSAAWYEKDLGTFANPPQEPDFRKQEAL